MNANTIHCLICDKVIARKRPPMVQMQMSTGRLFAETYGPMVPNGPDDQGWFEVGPDCYRKVLAAKSFGFAR